MPFFVLEFPICVVITSTTGTRTFCTLMCDHVVVVSGGLITKAVSGLRASFLIPLVNLESNLQVHQCS